MRIAGQTVIRMNSYMQDRYTYIVCAYLQMCVLCLSKNPTKNRGVNASATRVICSNDCKMKVSGVCY